MRVMSKAVAFGAAGTAVATTLMLVAAGPASAASWHLAKAIRSTIPSGTGSILFERDGSVSPSQAGRYCLSVDSAVNGGIQVYSGGMFGVTPYGDLKCQGKKIATGTAYRVSGFPDGSCIVYGVDRVALEDSC
jgi:hypothetical protein